MLDKEIDIADHRSLIQNVKLCESHNLKYGLNYCSVTPANFYYRSGNSHPVTNHISPALIRGFHKTVQAGVVEMMEHWHIATQFSACQQH